MEKVIEEIMKVVSGDKEKVKEFLADPKAILEKHNIDFDAEKIKDIVEVVKAKVDLEEIAEKGEDILDGIKGFFKK